MEFKIDQIQLDRPQYQSPTDLDTFLPWANSQLQGEHTLVITRTVQSKYLPSKDKTKQKPKKVKTPTDSDSNAQSDGQIDSTSLDAIADNPIYIETTYDENGDLVRLKLLKNRKLPRLIFQIIALAIPYHKTLTSLSIDSGLHATSIYEISHFYNTNQITEICLDYTKLPEANYHILLDNDIIKHFSLSKCNINDDVVRTIASKLTFNKPAATSLSILNLSTNRITDVGVEYLAKMLRSNRQLSYLNLADNKITDEGAKSIFNTLTKFALTSEESLDKGRNLISYLKEKNELVLKTIKDLNNKKINKKKTTKQVDTRKFVDIKMYNIIEGPLENIFDRAEAIAESILGPINNPFTLENIEYGENVTYCLGNNTLSYLNLAFNNLSYCCVKIICDVLKSQSISSRKPKGLINIRIEGNYLPVSCPEFKTIDNLLLPGLSMPKNVESVRKKGASSSIGRNSMIGKSNQ